MLLRWTRIDPDVEKFAKNPPTRNKGSENVDKATHEKPSVNNHGTTNVNVFLFMINYTGREGRS